MKKFSFQVAFFLLQAGERRGADCWALAKKQQISRAVHDFYKFVKSILLQNIKFILWWKVYRCRMVSITDVRIKFVFLQPSNYITPHEIANAAMT